MGLSFEVNFTNQTSLHGPKKMWIIQPEGGDQMFVCEIQQPLNLPAHKQPRHLEELFRSVKMWNRMNNNRIEKQPTSQSPSCSTSLLFKPFPV